MRALLFAAALCLPASAQIGRGVNFYSPEKEVALGQTLATEFERQGRILDNATVEQYISDLGARLVDQLPADTIAFPYKFRVLVSPSDPGTHEPNAFPGGFIFVPTSLLLAAQDEGELAGMLAHSIAHIAARHGTRAETRGQIANQASIPLIFMGGWPGYGIRQAAQTAVPLGMLTFARGFEMEADKIAVQLLSGAGLDPSALARYIERTQVDPTSPTFSLFPTRAQRLDRLREAIAKLPALGGTAPDFRQIQELVRGNN